MTHDRAVGALLGLAVGDALGTSYEFRRIEQPPYPTLATGPADDVRGGGPFSLAAGAVTDDTQMAVCLARSLAERGQLDDADVARRYVAWCEHAFDVGNQTSAALDKIARGEAPHRAGLAVWRESAHRAAGNGSLMRAAPLGVWGARTDDRRVAASLADSTITHADPRCAIACAMFCAAIARALDGAPAAARCNAAIAAARLAAAALRARDYAADELVLVDDAERTLLQDLDVALGPDPRVYGEDGLHLHGTAGFVRVAFRLAFWHDAHTPRWRDAVVDVASRGGDADTNAAIVGALLGARDGADAIPGTWRERVLAATLPGPPEWADAHHPRHLLELT